MPLTQATSSTIWLPGNLGFFTPEGVSFCIPRWLPEGVQPGVASICGGLNRPPHTAQGHPRIVFLE